MGEVGKRLLQTLRMERDAFVWMDFSDRATGDAVILVAVTQLLMFLGIWGGRSSLFSTRLWEVLIQFILGGLIIWLVYAAIVFAIIRFLIQGPGEFATYLRFSGFAFPTRLLAIAVVLLLNEISLLAVVLGSLWFLAIMARGIQYESDLPVDRAWLVAIGGLVGTIIVNAILGFSQV
jgi:hypothetical protein